VQQIEWQLVQFALSPTQSIRQFQKTEFQVDDTPILFTLAFVGSLKKQMFSKYSIEGCTAGKLSYIVQGPNLGISSFLSTEIVVS